MSIEFQTICFSIITVYRKVVQDIRENFQKINKYS